MLLPPRLERRTPVTAARPVVVALRANDRGALARAIEQAADRRRALHLVARSPQLPAPWVIIAGGQPWRGLPDPVEDLAQRLRAAGVDVEVHRTTGRPSRLAQAIAATCGADLVT